MNQEPGTRNQDAPPHISLITKPIYFDQISFFPAPDWWSRSESNRRPPECKSGALPTELRPRSG